MSLLWCVWFCVWCLERCLVEIFESLFLSMVSMVDLSCRMLGI